METGESLADPVDGMDVIAHCASAAETLATPALLKHCG